ncbi:MAG: arylesterase [Gammaproteobacteria bacterium]
MRLKSSFLVLSSFLLVIVACSDKQPELKPLKPSATILAFGDSLTYGTGANKEESYPAVLSHLTGMKVINAGVAGEISAKGKNRLASLLKKHKPDLVFLCHGGNDLLQKMDKTQTINNLKAMIKMIKDNQSQVILISVPQPGIFLSPAPLYEQIAVETQTPIITGVLSEIISSNELKSDAVHPNAKGYYQLAEAVFELLVESKAVSAR